MSNRYILTISQWINILCSPCPPANPFGSVSSAPFSSAAPSASVNPFGTPQQPQMGQFSQAGVPGMPASSAAPGGFGANFPPATSGMSGLHVMIEYRISTSLSTDKGQVELYPPFYFWKMSKKIS